MLGTTSENFFIMSQ